MVAAPSRAFDRTDHHKIMLTTYAIKAGKFTVEHVRPWSGKQLFDTGVMANYDVGCDGRIAALLPADNPEDRPFDSAEHSSFVLLSPLTAKGRVGQSRRPKERRSAMTSPLATTREVPG
jgi:hypothetical protein